MSRQYNFIYKRLVEDESDIVGNIAYSLYKADKIKFIEDFKAKHLDQEPTEEDFSHFHDACCIEANIVRYKMQALNILQNFMGDTLSATTRQIEKDLEANYKKELTSIIGGVTLKSFSMGVLQSVIGAFIFMIIMCAVIFFLKFSDSQYTFTIGGNGNAEFEVIENAPCDTIR